MFDDAMKTINRNGLNANRSESTYTNMMMMFAELGSGVQKNGQWLSTRRAIEEIHSFRI